MNVLGRGPMTIFNLIMTMSGSFRLCSYFQGQLDCGQA
jgi:hypothetical protein